MYQNWNKNLKNKNRIVENMLINNLEIWNVIVIIIWKLIFKDKEKVIKMVIYIKSREFLHLKNSLNREIRRVWAVVVVLILLIEKLLRIRIFDKFINMFICSYDIFLP